MSRIYDQNGAFKFEIKQISSSEKKVYDQNGKLLGSIKDGRTYDPNGRLVSIGEDISSLTIKG